MDIAGFLAQIQVILDRVVPFIVGLAVFIVIWGIFGYISHSAEEEKRQEARQFILWGVIGVFCMLSVWGFVNILYNSFTLDRQIDGSKIPKVPTVQGGSQDGGVPFDEDEFFTPFLLEVMNILRPKYKRRLKCSLFLLSVPFIALAADVPLVEITDPPADATDLVNRISTYILNPVIYVLFAAAFVVFIWGLVQFVANLDNEEARATGGKHMLWGIIGMAIMVGVPKIVEIIQNTIAQIGG